VGTQKNDGSIKLYVPGSVVYVASLESLINKYSDEYTGMGLTVLLQQQSTHGHSTQGWNELVAPQESILEWWNWRGSSHHGEASNSQTKEFHPRSTHGERVRCVGSRMHNAVMGVGTIKQ